MERREFLAAGLATALAVTAPFSRASAAPFSRVRPGDPGWPGESEWAKLGEATKGRLSKGVDPGGLGPDVETYRRNPFYRGDTPSLTESVGYLDAWRTAPSAYVVAAESAEDVAATVRFADAHDLRLVIKGAGHSYLGTCCAPDSLLIWTRRMNAIEVHDAFVPAGSSAAPIPAVSLGAGCIWLHAYEAVTGGAKRYVQGGGCTTVGVGGHLLGGGFGSFSKQYGLAAASLVEAEVVTADGEIRVVNAAKDADLFWALKGGGGGAFGVVTRFTLATHALPDFFGGMGLVVTALSDDAYRRLIARFLDLYATALFNPTWGEQAKFGPDNKLRLSMVFQGLAKSDALDAFKPLIDFVAATPNDFLIEKALSAGAIPAAAFWNPSVYRKFAPDFVVFDDRPGASASDYCWTGDRPQAGAFWEGYQSAWLPASLLEPSKRGGLADALLQASRHWYLELHFNKGLAGAPEASLAAARDTPIHPDACSAFALAISGSLIPNAPAEGSPEQAKARENAQRIKQAMAALRTIAPDAGSYLNEADYFQEDWPRAFWGANYERLADIKRRYDPKGLFFVHHGVGSEAWSPDGFTRRL